MRKKALPLIEVLQQANLEKENDKKIYLPDECGDSLWDEVLQQDDKKAPQNNDNKTPADDTLKK